MVVTVEPGMSSSHPVSDERRPDIHVPGIYVPPTPNFPKHFHNIGIRIEVWFLSCAYTRM